MDDRAEKIIKKVAIDHGVALDKDDPLMLGYTLNEEMFKDNMVLFDKHFKENVENWEENQKKMANLLLEKYREIFENKINSISVHQRELINQVSQSAIKKIKNTKLNIENKDKNNNTINTLLNTSTLIIAVLIFLKQMNIF